MHDCWIAGWGDVDRDFSPVFYLLGYVPRTHRRRQVMVAGYDGSTNTVELPRFMGKAHITDLGRYCAVIKYGTAGRTIYYEPTRNRFVGFCHWNRQTG